MNYDLIRIPEEKKLGQSLDKTLQAEAVLQLAKDAQHPVFCGEQKILENIERNCFLVEANTSPRYYKLFMDVLQRLDYKEPVRFYIKACAEPNAMSVLSNGKRPHAIVINSATLQIMHDDEVRQIIGHEIGHLIIRQGKLFPVLNTLTGQIQHNPSLGYKVRLWQQLSELTADRFGFMAVPDLKVRISADIKFAAGMPQEQLMDDYDIDYQQYIDQTKAKVEHFRDNYGVSEDSHPTNFIRLAALDIFSKSHWIVKGGLSDKELAAQTRRLILVLNNVAENEQEVAKAHFYAAAGLIVGGCDGPVNEDELDHIYQNIAPYYIFPKSLLKIIAQQDFFSVLDNAVEQILEDDPGNPELRVELLKKLIAIAFADQSVHVKEVDIVLNIAEALLGFSRRQAAQIFLDTVHEHFMPNPEDIF